MGINYYLQQLPLLYWIVFGGFFVALVILIMLTGGQNKLKGGRKRVPDGPLGNARFATEKELNQEYPTIEYKFREWCKIGRKREASLATFEKYARMCSPTSVEEAEKLNHQREQLYTYWSMGLPQEPGLLMGDWHVKGRRQNYKGIPKYIQMHSVQKLNPVSGQKEKKLIPFDISKHPEAWKGGKVMCRVSTDDVHAMLVASSGAGKSAFFLYPQVIYAMCCGQSFVITDTKGDNVKALQKTAKECFGYHILSLDLRNPGCSARFNIMHMVNKYTDLYEACRDKKSLEAIGYAAKREAYAKLVANTIVKGSHADYGQNSYFYDSAVGLVQACILLVSEYAEKDERHIVSVYNLIQAVSGVEGEDGEEKTGISVLLDELAPDDKIRFFAGPAAQNAGDSQASVVSTAMSKLLSFLDSEMEQVLCGDSDVDAEKFCEEKTILFITMPEENNTRYFLVSLVVSELYNELLAIASQHGNYIPAPKGFRGEKQRITFFLDEFGTLPKIDGFEMMMSAARSRGIFFVPILQGISQLERNYGRDSAKIIMDNCKLTFFSGISSTSEDAEFFSKKLGNYTVITNSVSNSTGGKGSRSRSLNMQSQSLMSPDDIRNMDKGEFVILRTADVNNTGHPVRCRFDLFLDWGITLDKEDRTMEREITVPRYAVKDQIIRNIRQKRASAPIAGIRSNDFYEAYQRMKEDTYEGKDDYLDEEDIWEQEL